MLALEGISKRFHAIQALDSVSFDVRAGEVHVLMGENGAGKSTLMKIIDGIYQPDAGTIMLEGRPVSIHSPKEAQELGIAMIHQELNNVLEMTVAENLFLGREPVRRGLLDKRRMLREAGEVLGPIAPGVDPAVKLKSLSVAQMQMVEITKAVLIQARILIMDEPTSAISDKEIDALFGIIRMLRERGVAIVYISHRMNEVFQIADRITVLRDGRDVGTYPASELDQGKLVSLMVGRELTRAFPPVIERELGAVVLEAEGLCGRGAPKDVSFRLRAGEILGVAGLMGAGRSELLEVLFGLRRRESGTVRVFGEEISHASPSRAIARRMAMVTEDRKRSGLNLKASVKADISIVTLPQYCTASQFISAARENAAVDKGMRALGIKAASRNQGVIDLSGGNQQKVVLARWLLTEPGIILMDEPTRGIDVGAKYEIYQIIRELSAKGVAIVLVSSEMPEIIGLCDRALVMHEGRVAGELAGADMSQEALMRLAAGMEG